MLVERCGTRRVSGEYVDVVRRQLHAEQTRVELFRVTPWDPVAWGTDYLGNLYEINPAHHGPAFRLVCLSSEIHLSTFEDVMKSRLADTASGMVASVTLKHQELDRIQGQNGD